MAPRILRGATAPSTETEAPETTTSSDSEDTAPAPAAPVPAALPDKRAVAMAVMATQLRALRATVEANFDYVGNRFADEARRIHTGDAEHRDIYGEATPEEAEALEDDGIAVSQIPWIRDDA